jgi:hypothetical protein
VVARIGLRSSITGLVIPIFLAGNSKFIVRVEYLTVVGTLKASTMMNMQPALSVQRSGAKQLSSLGASGSVSSSFPVLPPLVEDNYTKYPDSFQVTSEREPMTNSIPARAPALVSNSSIDGHLFTFPPGFSNDVHFSPVSPHGRNSQNSPFISQSSTEAALINHHDRNQDISWPTDSLEDFLNFPQNAPVQNGQVESGTGVITSEDHARRNDWQWVDGLISEMDSDWTELPNVNVADPEPKVCSSSQSDSCTYLP